MKWGKFLSIVLIIVLVFIVIPVVNGYNNWSVEASQFPYARASNNSIYISKIAGFPGSNLSTSLNISSLHPYIGSVNISISGSNGYTYSNTYSASNSNASSVIYGQNEYNVDAYYFQFVVGTTLASGVNYIVNITFNNAEFVTAYYDWVFNGSISLKFTTNGTNWVSTSNAQANFNLVYNNDYNYTNNKASFTMQYSNFSFNYFTFLNTDAVVNGGLGGFHLLNYSISNNIVNCAFDNTYETMSNPHYLVWVAHGLDSFGNAIDLSGSISFNINVDTLPKVKNYKVSYVLDGSPCIAGSGGGRLYLYIDYGSGYVLQDVSKWSATITQIANGGLDDFSYGVPQDFDTFYKLSISKVDDIDTYNYDIYVNDTAKHLTGQLNVCANSDYVYDSYGNKSSGEETDIFTLLKEIKDIFIGLWNLILSIVDFFGALLIAIFSIAYSMGVAVISLLKIVVDFVASVSSILFNRNTNYYSLVNVMSLPNSFTYQGKVIALSGLWGVVDNQLHWVHDNIIIQYSGLWAVIGLIYLIRKHILIEKVEDEDE